jgi:hypothetical protein
MIQAFLSTLPASHLSLKHSCLQYDILCYLHKIRTCDVNKRISSIVETIAATDEPSRENYY